MLKPIAIAASLLLCAPAALAQQGGPSSKVDRTSRDSTGAAQPVTGTGTVRQVDAKARKLNLAHDAIPAIRWPAMQMDFQIAPGVDLSQLKVGQPVEFTLSQAGDGSYTVTSVKSSR